MFIHLPRWLKVATALNAKIHHPDRDMSVSKIELVESYLDEKFNVERSNLEGLRLSHQNWYHRMRINVTPW